MQYAIVGAGLDTWALRMAAQLPAVRIFELDQPAMLTWKTRLYERNGCDLPSSLCQLGIDLRETGTVQGLKASGMDLDSPVSLSMLGLLVYLSDEAVKREIFALSRMATGSNIMQDSRVDEQQLSPMEQMMMQFTAQMMAAGGEPWHASITPQRMARLLGSVGFEVEEDLGPALLNARFFAGRCDGLQIAGSGFHNLSALKRA